MLLRVLLPEEMVYVDLLFWPSFIQVVAEKVVYLKFVREGGEMPSCTMHHPQWWIIVSCPAGIFDNRLRRCSCDSIQCIHDIYGHVPVS